MHIILDSKPNFINEDEGHKHGQGENKCPKNRFQSFEFCTGTPTFAHTRCVSPELKSYMPVLNL